MSAVPTEDADLVTAIERGDGDAENALLLRFTPRVRSMFQSSLRSAADIEDLIQETLRGALNSLRSGRFRGDCALGTFIHAVARNKLAEFLRRKRPPPAELTDDLPDRALSPEETLARREIAAAVREAVQSLAPKYRTVLYMYYFQGLSVAETAAHLGVPARKVTEWKDYGLQVIRRKHQSHLDRFR